MTRPCDSDVAAGTTPVKRCEKCGRVSGHATFLSDRGLCHRCEVAAVTTPRKGDRLTLTGPIVASSWLGGDTEYRVTASATVVEVLGRSIRVRVDEVSGIPRRFRAEAGELLEGWHRLDDLGIGQS